MEKMCTGCNSCRFFCPTGAISIFEMECSTFVKIIDKSKCTDCGMCDRLCHVNGISMHKTLDSYIAESRIFEFKKHGASGGIASSFYKYGLENGYLCIGTALERGRVVYKKLESMSDVKKASGSKYVLSHLDNLYEELQKLSDYNNRKIMFIGLPCHCATIKKIFEKRKYDVLYVDIVCNGVCSERLLECALMSEGISLLDAGDIRFREKNNQYGITIRDEHWDVVKKIENKTSEYMLAYAKRKNVFKHCRNCIYAQNLRVGDITLKDYVWKYGISNVLINTMHGAKFWEKISGLVYARKYAVERVIAEDERLG